MAFDAATSSRLLQFREGDSLKDSVNKDFQTESDPDSESEVEDSDDAGSLSYSRKDSTDDDYDDGHSETIHSNHIK